jgi:hypothetical protein
LNKINYTAQFNKKYKEELNDQLRDIDNARQRAELKAAQSATIGEDIESLLLGDPSLVDTTMRGKALRGGKPNITGDIVYQDASMENQVKIIQTHFVMMLDNSGSMYG